MALQSRTQQHALVLVLFALTELAERPVHGVNTQGTCLNSVKSCRGSTECQLGLGLRLQPHVLRLQGGGQTLDDLDEEDADQLIEKLALTDDNPQDSNSSNVNIVFIGHVDAGKSTISGHILYDTGGLDDRTLEKYEREAKALGRESWKYAWAMDTTDEERAKGKTHEIGRATFSTDARHYTILDAPGHKNYVPHMIGGASQAEIAVLVVSARTGEFEAGFDRNGQTREHALLAKTAGVGFLIVAVNKMDECSWSKKRYDHIVENLSPHLKQVGFNLQNGVKFIPVEGLSGINLKEGLPSGTCDWYSGPTLLQLLDSVEVSQSGIDKDLRMSVSDKYKESETHLFGKLFTGSITKGQKVVAMPSNVTVIINTILVDGKSRKTAVAGDNVLLKTKAEDDSVRAGDVLCEVGKPCPVRTCFEVKLNVLACKSILSAGYTCIMHLHNSVVECQWLKVISVTNRNTGQTSPGTKIPFVRPGHSAVVLLEVQEALCVENYKDVPQLGRFVLREDTMTVAVGIISNIDV